MTCLPLCLKTTWPLSPPLRQVDFLMHFDTGRVTLVGTRRRQAWRQGTVIACSQVRSKFLIVLLLRNQLGAFVVFVYRTRICALSKQQLEYFSVAGVCRLHQRSLVTEAVPCVDICAFGQKKSDNF